MADARPQPSATAMPPGAAAMQPSVVPQPGTLAVHPTAQPSAAADAGVTVRCLGGFELSVSGQPHEQWRAGRARALFQYLVVHRGQLVSRETLIDALWPDPDAVAAGTSLKVAVHALRQSLGCLPGLQVVAQESSYQLQAPGLWLDVEQFEQLCRLGQQLEASGQTAAAAAVYARAADLYTGDFLPEVWSDWAVFRREGLKDQFLCILARLADTAAATADWHACVRWCRLILDQDCCREDAFRLLMLAHARLGQPGRVRRWFEVCQHVLRTHLDCEPVAETLELYETLMGPAGRARLTAP
jgi:DNA-binding SARP family transcriptional activator